MCTEPLNVLTAICVGERKAMGEVDFIVVMLENDLEGKGVIVAASLFLEVVLIIAYAMAVPLPH